MARIVTTHYRYKPPPKKKPKKLPVAVEVPVIVIANKPRKDRQQPEAPAVVTSISRRRARMLAVERDEAAADTDDAATARAMTAIVRTLGLKPPKGS
jgi:hypothetical protein